VTEQPHFLILDGHSLAYRAFHALPVENFATSSGQVTNAVYGFVSMLATLLKDQAPTHLAVAFDVSRQTFRSEQYPEYKATRAKTPDEFKGQVELIKEVLGALNIPVVTADGYEADDIFATLAAAAPMRVSIVTGDRDSFQLVNSRVTVLYPKKGMSDLAIMTPEAVQEKYGVGPQKYRDLAAMVGEASDNLPGVPGVGPKTAAKWIDQFGGLPEILAACEQLPGKAGLAFVEHAEQVQLNYQLNRLVEDAPVDAKSESYLKRDYDPSAVHQILDKLEFAALRPKLLAAWPTSFAETNSEQSETASADFAVSAALASGNALSKWLDAHAAGPIAIAYDGTFGQGTGSIEHIALVASDASGVWVDFVANRDILTKWFSSNTPKLIHDVKPLFWALGAQNVSTVSMDTAIAAYLANPGQRSFALADVVRRNLKRELNVGAADTGQLAFADNEFDGANLAQQARAVFDLAQSLEIELAQANALTLLRDVELPTAIALAEMESAGIAVDRAALTKLESDFDDAAQEATRIAHKAAGHEFNLGSPKQLQEVLFVERGLPKTKKIKTGYTTDAEALLGLAQRFPDDELLTALLRYREMSKLKQTVTGLIACIASDGRIHTTFNQLVAATGRLSSTDPNLQNIPVRTADGGRIREVFVVGEGYETLLTADYSQIEMRVMAHLCQDQALIAALTSGEDLHTTVGAQVFGVQPNEVDAEMRRKVKAMSYGLAYGLSAYGLAQQLGIGNDEAKTLMEKYFERFGGVRDYLAQVVVTARAKGYTESIMGRRRYLPDLNSDNRQLRDMAERAALNAPIQGSAADIVKVAMLKVVAALHENSMKSRVLLQVHDELVLEIAPGELDLTTKLVQEQMREALELLVPLEVSVGIGRSWASAGH
jgi:DNA polymerase-1